MKLKTIFAIALCATMVSCGNETKESPNKAPKAQPTTTERTTAGSIAYVDMDSLQANYQLYIDTKAAAEAKIKTLQQQIQQKEQALQNMQTSIQNKMQKGEITSEAQYKQEMKKFENLQASYVQLQEKAGKEMAELQEQSIKTVRDSINNFLAEYNKTKKYSLILDKASSLYADKSLDITVEVVAGLNKRYKK